MSVNGNLTDSMYWNDLWDSNSGGRNWNKLLTKTRRVLHWKGERIVARLLDTVNPGANVLELGCAPGTMLQKVHTLRPQLRLSGMDFSEKGCKMAVSLMEKTHIPASVHYGDVRTVRLPEQFDLVASFGLVEHFDDSVEILRCHARFCRPGGTVAVTLPNYAHPLVRFLGERFCPDNMAIHNQKIMNLRVLENAMKDAGLRHVRVGGDGGCQLNPWISHQDVASKGYAIAARIWNAGAILVPPQLGWHANFWALGQVCE